MLTVRLLVDGKTGQPKLKQGQLLMQLLAKYVSNHIVGAMLRVDSVVIWYNADRYVQKAKSVLDGQCFRNVNSQEEARD